MFPTPTNLLYANTSSQGKRSNSKAMFVSV